MPQVLPADAPAARRRAPRRATAAPAAASCAVLPPGAAQRSATHSPGRTASSLAGSAAAASCTQNSPCVKAGDLGHVGAGGEAHRARRQHRARRAARLPAGGSRRAAPRAGGRGDFARLLTPGRPEPRRRVQPRTSRGRRARRGPASATRRSTALTRPASGASPRARARATAVATAAWVGDRSSSSPAAPSRSTWRTGSGGALRRNGSSTASSVPSATQHGRGKPMAPRHDRARRERRQRIQCLLERPTPIQHCGQQVEGRRSRVGSAISARRDGRRLAAVQPAARQHLVGQSHGPCRSSPGFVRCSTT